MNNRPLAIGMYQGETVDTYTDPDSGAILTKNYSSALADILNPSSGYYVADAEPGMGCDLLQMNYKLLVEQLQMWNDRFNSGNDKERANIEQIIGIQQAKAESYEMFLGNCSAPPIHPTPIYTNTGADGSPSPAPAPTINMETGFLAWVKANPMLTAGISVALAFIIYKLYQQYSKNKKR